MQAPPVARFGFRLRTRQGIVVDNVVIPARDAIDAERRIRQIYRDCEILDRLAEPAGAAAGPKHAEAATSGTR